MNPEPSTDRTQEDELSRTGRDHTEASAAQDVDFYSDEAMIGTVIEGGYRLVEVVGKGGMSVVFKAHHQMMDRLFAVKMLFPHLVKDENALMRFQQEAKAIQALEHPNIIRVTVLGVLTNGAPYIVMDYLSGRSLADCLKTERLPVRRTLHIFSQICRGLADAHAHGIVHRDIKPSNIMLVDRDNDPDHVKIVDFGIAKLMPREGEEVHKLTQTGEIFGSPLYMSPEQWAGKGVDERSDIYSVGCVLYEALQGRPPHACENVFETMHKHLNELPAPLSLPGVDLPLVERLEDAAFKAMEKDPERRFPSMAEMARTLETILEDIKAGNLGRSLTSGLGRSQRNLKRAFGGKWTPRHTILAAVLVPLSVLVVAWLAVDPSVFFSDPRVPLADLPWKPTVPNPQVELVAEDKLRQMLLDSYHVVHLASFRYGDEKLRDLWRERADRCEKLGAFAEAVRSRRQSLRLTGKIDGTRSNCWCEEAELLAQDLMLEGSKTSYKSAAFVLGEVVDIRKHTEYPSVRAYVLYGDALLRLDQPDQALWAYQEALRLSKQPHPSDAPSGNEQVTNAITLCKIGDIYRTKGDVLAASQKAPEEAKAEYEKAQESYKEALAVMTESISGLRSEIDQTEMKAKKETLTKLLSEVLNDLQKCQIFLAYTEQKQGNLEDAWKHYDQGLAGRKSWRADWEKQVLANYAYVLWKTNHFWEAMQVRQRMKQISDSKEQI